MICAGRCGVDLRDKEGRTPAMYAIVGNQVNHKMYFHVDTLVLLMVDTVH